jgi:hypothetical protein
MNAGWEGSVQWLGTRLTLRLPDPGWAGRVAAYTGLTPRPDLRAGETPLLAVAGPCEVVVGGTDRREFRDPAQLEAWLFLTLSDLLLERSGRIALHAACVLEAGAAILLTAPPWSGKSSWALTAMRQGLAVVGDDQVVVQPEEGRVVGLPRPCKRRLLSLADEAAVAEEAVRTEWDGERLALEPRAPAHHPEAAYPVRLVCHLARHPGPGFTLHPLIATEATRLLLGQIRGAAPEYLRSVAAAVRFLAACPNVRVSVGDGEIAAAMAAVRAWPDSVRTAPGASGVPS